MSSSGLIYAAIALMWAAVLLPMWLRGHGTASENRSVERYGQAMRVLSHQSDDGDRDYDHEVKTPDAVPSSTKKSEATSARRPLTLAKRRARALGVLVGLTFLTSALAIFGLVPVWAAALAGLLLVIFVVNLRNQAKRAAQFRAGRRQVSVEPDHAATAPESTATGATAGGSSRRSARDSRREFVPGPSRAVVVETKGSGAVADKEVSADPALLDEETFGADDQWHPNPLPVPTYVTAPKAVRQVRVIDLTNPGEWSSGSVIDDAPEDLLAAALAADELDAVLEHEARGNRESDGSRQRAVGD